MRKNSCINLFVISLYGPTDYSVETQKDEFYDELVTLIYKTKDSDIVMEAGNLNARFGKPEMSEACLN